MVRDALTTTFFGTAQPVKARPARSPDQTTMRPLKGASGLAFSSYIYPTSHFFPPFPNRGNESTAHLRMTISCKSAFQTLMTVHWTRRLKSKDGNPSRQQGNDYIPLGYHQASTSFKTCVVSLGYDHSATVKIYSHIFSTAISLTAPMSTYRALYLRYPPATPVDIFVFSSFFYGVSFCFLLSATYHIISNHSPNMQSFSNQLDYFGIVILMWGSAIPSIYHGFYCDPLLQKIYWANVSILAILCIVATLHPRFRHPTLRPYRAAMYAGLGLSAVVFVVHGILLHGWTVQNRRMSVDWMGLMALFNLTGAVIYAARVPEKLRPLEYDFYGNSHQVLHVAVVLAGLAHMFGLFRASITFIRMARSVHSARLLSILLVKHITLQTKAWPSSIENLSIV